MWNIVTHFKIGGLLFSFGEFIYLFGVMWLLLLNSYSYGLLTVSSCFNEEREFIYNNESLNFFQAISACEDENSTLTKVDNREVFDFITNFAINELAINVDFWVGMRRRREETISTDDPLSFTFIDGTRFIPGEFGSQRDVLPWQEGAPNDFLNL